MHDYVGRGGFCRLSSGRYTADRASMHDLQMHLTNCAIQRRAADGGADAPAAIKWPVRRRGNMCSFCASASPAWLTWPLCMRLVKRQMLPHEGEGLTPV